MARLLVMLLSLLLALPAVAVPACHQPVASGAHAHHAHHDPTPPTAVATHDCIGCIPPSDWIGARIACPLVAQDTRRRPAAVPLIPGAIVRPTPPPPRVA